MTNLNIEYFENNNWSFSNEKTIVKKSFEFETFSSAISWMVEISFFAEKINHHPEWKNVYNKIDVDLTTHDEKGLSTKDIELAKFMDSLFDRYV
tara:strand:- start:93 stop:374 length:282 start_codon:yes stop_codon:yes gene_type:complete